MISARARRAASLFRRSLSWQLGVVVAALAMALLPMPRGMVEVVYAGGFYPLVRDIITAVSRLVDLALFDVLLVAGSFLVVSWWVWRLSAATGDRRRATVAGLFAGTLVAAAALYLVFLATWGLNYRREALASRLEYDAAAINAERLEALTASAISELNRLFDATTDLRWPQLDDLPDRLGPAFERVQRQLGGVRPASSVRPRRSLLTPYFRRAGIDGMIDPFFLQVLVNDTVLPFERPFVTAHEWAHLAGFAHEAEANFVGWLVCLDGDQAMQYSGWMFLVPRLLGALPEEAQRWLEAQLADGPRADYAALRARLTRVVPVVQQSARRLNDQYLRANRVTSGVASYGEVVQLVLGTKLGRSQWPASSLAVPWPRR